MFDDPNVVLHCEKIDKIYPGTKALDQVSFDLLKGKVNVLIGENGADTLTVTLFDQSRSGSLLSFMTRLQPGRRMISAPSTGRSSICSPNVSGSARRTGNMFPTLWMSRRNWILNRIIVKQGGHFICTPCFYPLYLNASTAHYLP